MKKILTLLVVSTFIASCTSNNIKTNENTGSIDKTNINENITKSNEETNTGNKIIEKQIPKEKDEGKSNTGITEKNQETNTGSNNNEEISVEDEKALESEVNDLLDNFINSLDNYDK